MRKLEEITAAEEQRIEKAEKDLEEDAVWCLRLSKFIWKCLLLFCSTCSINFSQRIIRMPMKPLACKSIWLTLTFSWYTFSLSFRADEEARKKLEKVAEIKRLHGQITALKSELVRREDELNELKQYKQFLDQITPTVICLASSLIPPHISLLIIRNGEKNVEKNSKKNVSLDKKVILIHPYPMNSLVNPIAVHRVVFKIPKLLNVVVLLRRKARRTLHRAIVVDHLVLLMMLISVANMAANLIWINPVRNWISMI